MMSRHVSAFASSRAAAELGAARSAEFPQLWQRTLDALKLKVLCFRILAIGTQLGALDIENLHAQTSWLRDSIWCEVSGFGTEPDRNRVLCGLSKH